MGFNKNLQIKSSISKKLLKAFKAEKSSTKHSKGADRGEPARRSMYFFDPSKQKFSIERMLQGSNFNTLSTERS